jgi:Bax protein
LPPLQVDYTHDIETLPNFSAYTDAAEKKQAFFSFLYPIVEKENRFLMDIRQQLLNLEKVINERTLTEDELNWLTLLSEDYSIDQHDAQQMLVQLLLHIDSVPPSMVLAQAAIESGWGTSRFARKGNNLFGHWCFERGCGLVPKSRDDDKSHEVAKFRSVNESIRAYLKNLNSFHRYEEFRKLRQAYLTDEATDVHQLLPGLLAYSELGAIYIKKVRRMINQNNLIRFDTQFYSQASKI